MDEIKHGFNRIYCSMSYVDEFNVTENSILLRLNYTIDLKGYLITGQEIAPITK